MEYFSTRRIRLTARELTRKEARCALNEILRVRPIHSYRYVGIAADTARGCGCQLAFRIII